MQPRGPLVKYKLYIGIYALVAFGTLSSISAKFDLNLAVNLSNNLF